MPFELKTPSSLRMYLSNIQSRMTISLNADLEIKKGSTIGFVGETGSGKSNRLDILMSLLELTDGGVFVDEIGRE